MTEVLLKRIKSLKENIKMKGDPMFDLFGDDVKNVLDEYNRK